MKRERELEPEAPGVANQSTHAPSLFPYLGLPGEYKGASHFQGVTLVLFSLFIIWTSQTPQTLRHSDTQTLVLVWTLLLLDSVLIATIYLPLPRRIPYVDYKP